MVDGDTIEIHGIRIRLAAIDAPESGQSCTDAAGRPYFCGRQAAFFLADVIGAHSVTCHDQGHDKYGRTLARCFIGSTDLQKAMVLAGWAIAYRRFSSDYIADEDAAHAAKAGIWQGDFLTPEAFRHPHF